MIKTIANIIQGTFKNRQKQVSNFQKIPWSKEKWIKHLEDRKLKEIKLNDLTIYYIRPYELLHSYKDIFVNEIYRFSSTHSSPVIVDCGSNIGLSVLYFKKLYPSAKIIAFEPDHGNYSILQKNVNVNRLNDIELNNAAVWIKDGTISFESQGSEASHIVEDSSKNTVKCISLKNVLNKHKTVDFLKIDIEGAEGQVMIDIQDELTVVNNLFLEYHGKTSDTQNLNCIFRILQRNGFKVYIKNAADNLSSPFVEKSTKALYDVQLNLFCFR